MYTWIRLTRYLCESDDDCIIYKIYRYTDGVIKLEVSQNHRMFSVKESFESVHEVVSFIQKNLPYEKNMVSETFTIPELNRKSATKDTMCLLEGDCIIRDYSVKRIVENALYCQFADIDRNIIDNIQAYNPTVVSKYETLPFE